MKTVHRPIAVLVARPQLVWDGVDRVIADHEGCSDRTDWRRSAVDGDGDGLVEFMGRLCYGSFGPKQGRVGAREYLDNVLRQGHGSVLEHANWSFVVLDGSRGLSAQTGRHRAGWAHSVESTHFVNYTTDATVSVCGLDPETEGTARAVDALRVALEEYVALWEVVRPEAVGGKKAACAAARGLLPTALRARHGFTANARALRHFCELRGEECNVPEIRYVASDVCTVMRKEAPSLFDDFTVAAGVDGHPVVTAVHRKV